MCQIKTWILCFISLACIFHAVDSICSIPARDRPPLFIKSFGSKKIFLPKNIGDIKLESGESMQAHCNSGMSLRSDYNNYITTSDGINAIEFYCNGSTLSFLGFGQGFKKQTVDMYSIYISCEAAIQQLYESNKNLPNCENYASYAIGIAPTEQPQIVTAGICYDLENLSLKYVTYMSHRPKYKFLEQKTNATKMNELDIALDMRLTGFKTLFRFMSQSTFNRTYAALKQKYPLLQLYDFEYVSLLQDASLQNELIDYENMFNIVWWRNLRLGNWKNFLKALEKQVQNTSTPYITYTGISGILNIPNKNNDYPEELVVQSEDVLLRVPAYIWSYMNSSKEEFVIIASNSPFLTTENINAQSNICKDICHEIDWLAESTFARTHLIPTMGLIHCCRIEDVANKLENFLEKINLLPKPLIEATTAKQEVTTTPQSKTNRK